MQQLFAVTVSQPLRALAPAVSWLSSCARLILLPLAASIPRRRFFLVRVAPASGWGASLRGAAAILLLALPFIALGIAAARRGQVLAPGGREESAMHGVLVAPHLLFRHTAPDGSYGQLAVAPLAAPGSTRMMAGFSCERVAFAAGRGLCLQADRGVYTSYRAVLLDVSLNQLASIELDGIPSRARISADGRVGAITVLLAESPGYGKQVVSNRTTLVDMTTGSTLADLETFSAWRNGRRLPQTDFEVRGTTFARDGNTFFATLQADGAALLVRGDLGERTLEVVRSNVESPSLSPDGRLIAFRKRVPGTPARWRLAVMDLASGREWPVRGEERTVDDQIEWLDGSHLLYGVARSAGAVVDIWVANIEGRNPSRLFLADAESPAIVP